jgi:hypothetical protein
LAGNFQYYFNLSETAADAVTKRKSSNLHSLAAIVRELERDCIFTFNKLLLGDALPLVARFLRTNYSGTALQESKIENKEPQIETYSTMASATAGLKGHIIGLGVISPLFKYKKYIKLLDHVALHNDPLTLLVHRSPIIEKTGIWVASIGPNSPSGIRPNGRWPKDVA